ncbi:MAG: hypothetical protein LBK42_11800 [Propionibacteriaceae bacterium]|jgi:hypothetical protein|nr:hypothetical protein [Propionibacteriaceae bacterium]
MKQPLSHIRTTRRWAVLAVAGALALGVVASQAVAANAGADAVATDQPAPSLAAAPDLSLTGQPAVGEILSLVAEHPATQTWTFQWLRDGQVISGQTDSWYYPHTADVGHQLALRVTITEPDVETAQVTTPAVLVLPGAMSITLNTQTPLGTPKVGQAIELDASPATCSRKVAPGDSGTVGLAVQWLRDGQPIAGATYRNYYLQTADVNHSLAARLTCSQTGYEDASATTNAVIGQLGDTGGSGLEITSLTFPTPVYVGYAYQAGYQYTQPSADSQPTAAWQWLRDGQPIAGATSRTYTTTVADQGHQLAVRLELSLAGYTTASRTSAAATVVASVSDPEIVGLAQVGQALGAKLTYPQDGVVACQWLRDSQAISGANQCSYVVQPADVGRELSFQANVTLAGVEVGSATSAPVTVSQATFDTVQATIQSSLKVGDQTKAGAQIVYHSYGVEPTRAWQWLRDGQPIAGATSDTYTVLAADRGHKLSARLTVSLAGYVTAVATSGEATVESRPVVIEKLTIAGAVQAGQTISADFQYAPQGATFVYQWLRDGQAIAGATNPYYQVQDSDKGHYLSVKVTGSATDWDQGTLTSSTALVPGGSFDFDAVVQSLLAMLKNWIAQLMGLFA